MLRDERMAGSVKLQRSARPQGEGSVWAGRDEERLATCECHLPCQVESTIQTAIKTCLHPGRVHIPHIADEANRAIRELNKSLALSDQLPEREPYCADRWPWSPAMAQP